MFEGPRIFLSFANKPLTQKTDPPYALLPYIPPFHLAT